MAIVTTTKEGSDYAPTWNWLDGEEIAGSHVDFRRASTDNGPKVVWEINSDEHGPVSVWLDPATLVSKVRGELARRKERTGEPRLKPGERIRLNPGMKRPSKRTPGQTVWPFRVVEFEHGIPDTSAEELLLSGGEPSEDSAALEQAVEANEPALGAPADDDIPF